MDHEHCFCLKVWVGSGLMGTLNEKLHKKCCMCPQQILADSSPEKRGGKE